MKWIEHKCDRTMFCYECNERIDPKTPLYILADCGVATPIICSIECQRSFEEQKPEWVALMNGKE